jgi:hypothetical protein
MGIVNDIAGGVVDLLMGLLSWLHPVLLILALALLVAAGSLVVFKWTSRQEAIRRAKARVTSHLLAVVLFRHDLRVLFRSLGLAFLGTILNLRFLFVPLLVMIVPLTILFVQLDHRLGIRALGEGEATVLRVHAAPGTDLSSIGLEGDEHLVVETPGVRVTDPGRRLREVDFRIRATAEGAGELRVLAGAARASKRVRTAPDLSLKSPLRPGPGILDRLFHPGEDPIPGGSPIAAIEVIYPPIRYGFLGIEWAWWTLFLVFLVLGLFLLRGPLGVQF